MKMVGVSVVMLVLTACNRAEQQEPLPAYFDPFADVKRTINETASSASMAAAAPSKPQTGR